MRRDRMHMSLASNRPIAKPSMRVHHDAEEEHASLHLFAILDPAHVHRDGINGIGSRGVRVAQALPDGVERTMLRARPKYAVSVLEVECVSPEANVEAGIERVLACRIRWRAGAHASLPTSFASPSTLRRRALKPLRRMDS